MNGAQAVMLDFDQIMAPLGAQVFLRDYWLKQFVHIRGKRGPVHLAADLG